MTCGTVPGDSGPARSAARTRETSRDRSSTIQATSGSGGMIGWAGAITRATSSPAGGTGDRAGRSPRPAEPQDGHALHYRGACGEVLHLIEIELNRA